MALLAWDYETHPISKEHPYPKPVCVSTYNGWNKKLIIGDDIEQCISYILDNISIAHNATFELGVTWTWFPNLRPKIQKALAEGRIHCTMILQQILNARIEHEIKNTSLSSLVLHYLGEDISEDKKSPASWRLRYNELEGVPLEKWPQEAKDYSIMDSVYAFKLYKLFTKHNIDSKRAMEASFYLNMIGKTGIPIDQTRVKCLEEEIYAKLEPAYEYLISKGLCTKIGARRPKKNMKELNEYIKTNVSNPLFTPKGNIRTDLEALTSYYLDTNDKVFECFLELNEYDKVLTTFISRLKGADLIRTDYKVACTTGRTSSTTSKLYPSVNIQQMPRKVSGVTWDVRNCFVPRPGFKMVSIDYSGLELASCASQLFKTFGRSEMLNMLNSGDEPVDLHSMLAAQIMTLKGQNTTYQTFIELKKQELYASMRQLCKAINLGFPGGIGYDVMRQQLLQGGTKIKYGVLATSKDQRYLQNKCFQLKLKEPNLRVQQISGPKKHWCNGVWVKEHNGEYALVYDELVGLKQNMFKVYPDLERFLKEHHQYAMTGEIQLKKDKFGQWEKEPMYKYQVGDFYHDWCTYTAYCNGYLMQTPSAIGATNTAIQLGRKYLGHPDVNLLAFIHDEFIFEIRESRMDEISEDIAEMMIDGMKGTLKHVRIAIERSYMDYWTKESKDVKVYWKDANSNLLRSK